MSRAEYHEAYEAFGVGAVNYEDFGPPIPVEDGIRARSKRGTIGKEWWSRRFIDVVERFSAPGRLTRARSYARSGQVMDLTIEAGLVRATVQGSRPEPYAVHAGVRPFDDDQWERVVGELRGQAIYRAKLLAGEMPPAIEELFSSLSLPLFPQGLDDLALECSCPDFAVPCKHQSAALYLLAESFDSDPFLILAWRGRDRETLLSSLRMTESSDTSSPVSLDVTDDPLTERADSFFEPGTGLARLRERPARIDAPADLLLRTLDPLSEEQVEALAPAYARFAEAFGADHS